MPHSIVPLTIIPLDSRFISITGPDAIKFLQGQCSCDLLNLSDSVFSYGTLNTPKGRMYSLFKVIKTTQGLLLSLEQSLLDSTLEKLRKYAVFFKCELKACTDYKAFGLIDFPADTQALHVLQKKGSYLLTLSAKAQLHEVWLSEGETTHAISQFFPNLVDLSLFKEIALSQENATDFWHAKETLCGIPALYSSTQEEFILQTLNLHQLAAVSFKKGCYTGQEIIARMKFLGKLKKKSFLLKSETPCTAEPNQSLLDAQGNKRGTLVRSHWSERTGSVALAILNIDEALNGETIYLEGHPDCPFTVSEPDYSEFKNKDLFAP